MFLLNFQPIQITTSIGIPRLELSILWIYCEIDKESKVKKRSNFACDFSKLKPNICWLLSNALISNPLLIIGSAKANLHRLHRFYAKIVLRLKNLVII